MAKHIQAKVGFYPTWWAKHIGITFGKKYYHDADYRVDCQLKMQKHLHERFGDIGLGDPNPSPNPVIDYGLVLLPAVFGCEIVFESDAIPWAMPLNLSEKECWELEVPDILTTPPMPDLIKQIDYLQEKYGKVTGSLNPTGVQNLALKIRGDQLYLDYFENPKLAHHVLTISTKTIIELTRFAQSRNMYLASGITPMSPPDWFCHPNCTIAQISNNIFEEFLLQYEDILADNFAPYGIHHCGSINEVAEGYAKIKRLDFLEVGPNSDLVRLRQLLPNTRINARIDPVRMLHGTAEEIAEDVRHLIDTGAPLETLSIDAVGCDYGTPDENVRSMLKTAKEYSTAKMRH